MSLTNFPTLLLTIIGVFAAFVILGSYYIFVIKCCLNWHRSASRTRPRRRVHGTHNQSFPLHPSEPDEPHGLDESVIKLIPSVAYRKPKEPGVFHVCAVCLTEFKEEEKTRVLPNCLHFFHVDCIDTWLHTNANCPLCRSPITTDLSSVAVDQELDHVHPEDSNEVVINIREDSSATSDSTSSNSTPASGGKRSSRKWSCRGDESIELGREKLPVVIPMRRSYSVDSSADRWLSKEVQKLLQQNPLFHETPLAGSSRAVPKINLPMDLQWILHASSS